MVEYADAAWIYPVVKCARDD